jgi:hypothetical protein
LEYYTKDADGTYVLAEDPTAKVKEFRDKNTALMKESAALKAKYEGVDSTDEAIVKLKLDLATEKSARAAAEAATVDITRRTAVSAAFLAAGGRPEAVDLILLKAPTDADKLVDWLTEAAVSKELAFAFHSSNGGGATAGSKPALVSNPNAKILRNPTPQELGQFSREIASGAVKIEITT